MTGGSEYRAIKTSVFPGRNAGFCLLLYESFLRLETVYELALCSLPAFWTGMPARIRTRAMRQAGERDSPNVTAGTITDMP